MLKNNGQKLIISSKREWYQVEPQQAAEVRSIYILSSTPDNFVIGEDGINFDAFQMTYYSHLKKLSVFKPVSLKELDLIQQLPVKQLAVAVNEWPSSIAMPKLRELSVFGNDAEILTPIERELAKAEPRGWIDLSQCLQLEELSISHIPCLDLKCLSEIKSLKRLKICHSTIVDVSPLKNLKLTDLVLNNCHINSISSLSEIGTLQTVSLYGNEIEYAGPLLSLPCLEVLDLRKNYLHDSEEIRSRFRGKTLLLNAQDWEVEIIKRDIKAIQYRANMALYNRAIQFARQAPSSGVEPFLYKQMINKDYDSAYEEQVEQIVRGEIKGIKKNHKSAKDEGDYLDRFITEV